MTQLGYQIIIEVSEQASILWRDSDTGPSRRPAKSPFVNFVDKLIDAEQPRFHSLRMEVADIMRAGKLEDADEVHRLVSGTLEAIGNVTAFQKSHFGDGYCHLARLNTMPASDLIEACSLGLRATLSGLPGFGTKFCSKEMQKSQRKSDICFEWVTS